MVLANPIYKAAQEQGFDTRSRADPCNAFQRLIPMVLVTMVRGDLKPRCSADWLLTGLGQPH